MVKSANEESVGKGQSNVAQQYNAMQSPSCETQFEDFEVLVGDMRDSLGEYLKKRPLVASALVFLAGFYVGWKIKPW